MRFWADDSDFYSDTEQGTPDVFVFGGLIVSTEEEQQIAKAFRCIKGKYGHERAPVKWNLKDMEHYYGDSDKSKSIYEQMRRKTSDWRADVFDMLASTKAVLLVTAIEAYSDDKGLVLSHRDALARQAFANALMRFALHVDEHKPVHAEMVIDWPASNDRKPFNDEYHSAYRYGKNCDGQEYTAGKLHELPMADAVFFSTTRHSCMLQLADLVVGSTRDFMKACLTGAAYGPGFQMVKKVRERYRGAPGRVMSRGMNVSTGNKEFRKKLTDAVFHDIWDKPRP
ncbi:MAG: DUF3800 domain-containing protein [Ramlibacter sp.]|nr:DUF3800 domain-containing protein [Ramlibacter sp.]MCW5650986.1 DUF3800 domain-containing protein [Ramlibacter sp.]